MKYYASLNESNICVGFQITSSNVQPVNSVLISEEEYQNETLLYKKYANGQWSEEKFLPPTPPKQETLEEKIERLERRIQQDNLINFEVLATIYEELIMKG